MKNLNASEQQILARLEAATPGPWVFGGWTIFAEDREAQKQNLPFWTLIEGDTVVTQGPFGRKSLEPDGIIISYGYEAEGLCITESDTRFITNSPTDIRQLLETVDQLRFERDEYKRLAESWMTDYDELKNKYEPLEAALEQK